MIKLYLLEDINLPGHLEVNQLSLLPSQLKKKVPNCTFICRRKDSDNNAAFLDPKTHHLGLSAASIKIRSHCGRIKDNKSGYYGQV